MSIKSSNGNLYNYNPLTQIMPNTTYSWSYYKYIATNTTIIHDITQDLNKLYFEKKILLIFHSYDSLAVRLT